MEAYSHEELGTYISPPRKDGDRFIGTCIYREHTYNLEHDRVIKIISEEPMK